MSKTNKSAATMVEVSITTFDNGDETIRFTSTGTSITVKELGKVARKIEAEAAVAWMTEMELGGWGVTYETAKAAI